MVHTEVLLPTSYLWWGVWQPCVGGKCLRLRSAQLHSPWCKDSKPVHTLPFPLALPWHLTSSSPQSHSSPSSRYPFPHLRPPYSVLVSGILERHIPPPDCRYLSSSFLLQPLNTLGKGCLAESKAGVSWDLSTRRPEQSQSYRPWGRFHLDSDPHSPRHMCSVPLEHHRYIILQLFLSTPWRSFFPHCAQRRYVKIRSSNFCPL